MKQTPSNKRDTPTILAGEYLKRVRESKNLTKVALAKLTGLHGTDLSKYELNKTKMTLNMFLKICRAVGVIDFNEIFKKEIELNRDVSLDDFIRAYEEQKRKNIADKWKRKRESEKNSTGRSKNAKK